MMKLQRMNEKLLLIKINDNIYTTVCIAPQTSHAKIIIIERKYSLMIIIDLITYIRIQGWVSFVEKVREWASFNLHESHQIIKQNKDFIIEISMDTLDTWIQYPRSIFSKMKRKQTKITSVSNCFSKIVEKWME